MFMWEPLWPWGRHPLITALGQHRSTHMSFCWSLLQPEGWDKRQAKLAGGGPLPQEEQVLAVHWSHLRRFKSHWYLGPTQECFTALEQACVSCLLRLCRLFKCMGEFENHCSRPVARLLTVKIQITSFSIPSAEILEIRSFFMNKKASVGSEPLYGEGTQPYRWHQHQNSWKLKSLGQFYPWINCHPLSPFLTPGQITWPVDGAVSCDLQKNNLGWDSSFKSRV